MSQVVDTNIYGTVNSCINITNSSAVTLNLQAANELYNLMLVLGDRRLDNELTGQRRKLRDAFPAIMAMCPNFSSWLRARDYTSARTYAETLPRRYINDLDTVNNRINTALNGIPVQQPENDTTPAQPTDRNG